jgi:hypothetical protein
LHYCSILDRFCTLHAARCTLHAARCTLHDRDGMRSLAMTEVAAEAPRTHCAVP